VSFHNIAREYGAISFQDALGDFIAQITLGLLQLHSISISKMSKTLQGVGGLYNRTVDLSYQCKVASDF
jgi:hypothetical protein